MSEITIRIVCYLTSTIPLVFPCMISVDVHIYTYTYTHIYLQLYTSNIILEICAKLFNFLTTKTDALRVTPNCLLIYKTYICSMSCDDHGSIDEINKKENIEEGERESEE